MFYKLGIGRLTANAKVATVLASTDTVDSEARQKEQMNKAPKNPPYVAFLYFNEAHLISKVMVPSLPRSMRCRRRRSCQSYMFRCVPYFPSATSSIFRPDWNVLHEETFTSKSKDSGFSPRLPPPLDTGDGFFNWVTLWTK